MQTYFLSKTGLRLDPVENLQSQTTTYFIPNFKSEVNAILPAKLLHLFMIVSHCQTRTRIWAFFS